MTQKNRDYDYQAYIKLTERYICYSILQNNIIEFLQRNIQLKSNETVSGLLERYTGKSRNTIYKNVNTLQVYNTTSFIRYWNSMLIICGEYGIPEEKVPDLKNIYLEYKEFFELMSFIGVENNLEEILKNYANPTLDLVNLFNAREKLLTENQISLLSQIKNSPTIKKALATKDKLQQEAQKERMKKTNE